jgi:hypothetical protein
MGYRLDQIQFLSTLPQYINTGTASGVINISGAIANGATANFSVTIPLPAKNTFVDVFMTDNVTGLKTQLVSINSATLIYAYLASETVQVSLTYTRTSVQVTVSIFNGTGFTITGLIPQTITVECIEYNIPF